LAGARVFLGATTSSTESSSSSDTSSNCRQLYPVPQIRQLTKACLLFGFAFAFDFDEEAFLAGILEASESRSILLYQLNRGLSLNSLLVIFRNYLSAFEQVEEKLTYAYYPHRIRAAFYPCLSPFSVSQLCSQRTNCQTYFLIVISAFGISGSPL